MLFIYHHVLPRTHCTAHSTTHTHTPHILKRASQYCWRTIIEQPAWTAHAPFLIFVEHYWAACSTNDTKGYQRIQKDENIQYQTVSNSIKHTSLSNQRNVRKWSNSPTAWSSPAGSQSHRSAPTARWIHPWPLVAGPRSRTSDDTGTMKIDEKQRLHWEKMGEMDWNAIKSYIYI